jgi:hypothetical protein
VSNRHGDSLDVSRYPPDIKAAYEVFAVRCSRCHTLARPLNARIDDPQHWVRYVARMRLNPSSGINAKDGQIILRFLLYYMHQRAQERGDSNSEPTPAAEGSSGEAPEDAPPSAAESGASETRLVDPFPAEARTMAEPRPSEMNP